MSGLPTRKNVDPVFTLQQATEKKNLNYKYSCYLNIINRLVIETSDNITGYFITLCNEF
jgi:hypothetical protein